MELVCLDFEPSWNKREIQFPSSYETRLSSSTCTQTDNSTHKSMNFSFHLCREITEKHMGDPLKTIGAKCITAKEITISLWTRYLPIAYQEEINLILSSSLSENTRHLKASRYFPLLLTATY